MHRLLLRLLRRLHPPLPLLNFCDPLRAGHPECPLASQQPPQHPPCRHPSAPRVGGAWTASAPPPARRHPRPSPRRRASCPATCERMLPPPVVHRFRLSGDVEESIEQLWNVRFMIEDGERNEYIRDLIESEINAISDSSCDTILDSVETVIKLHVSIREYAKTINAKIESLVQSSELRLGKGGISAQRDAWCTAALDAATEIIDVIDTELANGLFCEGV
ncbi:hypothetical protein T484DRAFT_1962561 [Baffinella frigidus]|nr:hypothetical protein T484DRAFT_1962561 [Cryptophyta sp. CCMP2293]